MSKEIHQFFFLFTQEETDWDEDLSQMMYDQPSERTKLLSSNLPVNKK